MKGIFFTLLTLIFLMGVTCTYGCEEERIGREQAVVYDEASGWSFVSVSVLHSDSDDIEHRFEVHRGQNKTVLLEHTFRQLSFLGLVRCNNYSVYFFSLPRIRPYGNIILGWRIPQIGIPELVFTSPFSENIAVSSEIAELKREGEFVCGMIRLRDAEKADSPVLNLEFTLSEDSPVFSMSDLDL